MEKIIKNKLNKNLKQPENYTVLLEMDWTQISNYKQNTKKIDLKNSEIIRDKKKPTTPKPMTPTGGGGCTVGSGFKPSSSNKLLQGPPPPGAAAPYPPPLSTRTSIYQLWCTKRSIVITTLWISCSHESTSWCYWCTWW